MDIPPLPTHSRSQPTHVRHHFSRSILAFISVVVAATTACTSDRIIGPTRVAENLSEGRGVFQRYFAIGTSVSAGVQGDGLIAANQLASWPAQLSTAAGRTLNLPLIDGTGCRSPLTPPLAFGKRLSGEGAGDDPAQLSCAPLEAGVFLSVDNVGLNGARTNDALYTTAQNIPTMATRRSTLACCSPGRRRSRR